MRKPKFLILFAIIGLFSCNNRTTSAYYSWETIFIKSEFGGSEVYKHYSAGSNKNESINQAEVDVLKALIFKGIKSAPDPKPLLFEVNAEEKYRSFFSDFFSKDGEYKNYVQLYRDGNINLNDRLKTGRRNDRKKKGVEIIVKKQELINFIKSSKELNSKN
jgi:hypothetical protein